MPVVSAGSVMHALPTVIRVTAPYPPCPEVVVADYYCPLPDCDCRHAVIVLSDNIPPNRGRLATVEYHFSERGDDAVVLAAEYAQGPDAKAWLRFAREVVLGTRAQRCEYERRYLLVKTAAIDPTAYGHSFLRKNAGLPPLPLPRPAPKGRGAKAAPTTLARDVAAEAATVLRVRNVADLLTGSELLLLAMALSNAESLSPDEAALVLHERGLPERGAKSIAKRMLQSARDSGRFARPEDERFLRLPRALLVARLDALLARPELRAPAAPPLTTPQPKAPAAPSPPARSTTTAPAAPAPPAAPASPAPAKPAVAQPPSPASFTPAPHTLPALTRELFAQALAAEPRSPESVRLALEAQRLASAAQFDELLALASMRDITPHRYQVETVRRVLRALRGRAILADEVGLGKTVEAIMVLREYQVRGMVRRALVLCPPTLVAQWAGELAQKGGVTARTTDDPRLRDAYEDFWGEAGVVVSSLALARSAKHAPAVSASPWDIVIVDEAHHIKNRATLGYKLVSELKRRFLLLVTATPVENDLEEVYNLVTLLRPGQFDTPAAFRKRFVDPKDPTRPRDKDALRGLLGEVMVRNTRAQSGLALPPRFVSTLAVDPSPEERALYEAVVAFVRAHHEDTTLTLAANALLLEAGSSPRAVRATLTRMIEKRDGRRAKPVRDALEVLAKQAEAVTTTRKVEALLGVVAAQREPVLVFTRFRETLEEVAEAVERAGVAAVPFHGGLDEPGRREALARFRAGGAVVMVATAAGSEGHNLQHCNVLVNFDLPWNPMAIEQRIGRLHRMGQTREVHVYNLCARGTIEERVLDVLDRRVQLFQLVVGEMDMVLGNIADERDLEDWIAAAVARSKDDAEVDATFDRLAEELLAARGRYEKTKALDEALFGGDFEA